MKVTREFIEQVWSRMPVGNFIDEIVGLMRHVDALAPLDTVLEIGVGFGGSLRLWEESVSPQGLVIALDDSPKTIDRLTGKISTHQLQADSEGWTSDWEIESVSDSIFKMVSDKEIYVVIGDSCSLETKAWVESLLAGRKIDFIFHDGQHYGPTPVLDYGNFQHYLRDAGLLCVADVYTMDNDNCGCQELYRALPEPKIGCSVPYHQGMALWKKPAGYVLDAEDIIKRTGLR